MIFFFFKALHWYSGKPSHLSNDDLFKAMHWLSMKPCHHSDHDLFRAVHWLSMKPWHHNDHVLFFSFLFVLFFFSFLEGFALLSGKLWHLNDHACFRAMHWSSTKPLRRPRAPWTTWMAQNCWVRKWQWTGVSSEGLDRPSQCGLLLLLLLAVV